MAITPMTPDQEAALKASITTAVTTAGTLVDSIDPALLPFVVLGQAIAAQVPSLVEDVQNLLAGSAPTDAAVTALAQKIAALGNPASL